MAKKTTYEKCLNCKKDIKQNLYSGYWQTGDEITCPNCGQVFVHDCDEAEGCCWFPRVEASDSPERKVKDGKE